MSLDIEKFGEMIIERRGAQGVRAAAKEAGVSPATLSRIENGHIPDLATFAAICRWLGENPAKFLGMQPAPSNETSTARVHLRKKKTTSIETATALGALIIAAQNALRDRESI